MIVTSVQIKTVKMQKHLYCPVFTKKSRILIGILLFSCNQQDLNLRTSFQTASRYGAAVWEKPPAAYSNALLHRQ